MQDEAVLHLLTIFDEFVTSCQFDIPFQDTNNQVTAKVYCVKLH